MGRFYLIDQDAWNHFRSRADLDPKPIMIISDDHTAKTERTAGRVVEHLISQIGNMLHHMGLGKLRGERFEVSQRGVITIPPVVVTDGTLQILYRRYAARQSLIGTLNTLFQFDDFCPFATDGAFLTYRIARSVLHYASINRIYSMFTDEDVDLFTSMFTQRLPGLSVPEIRDPDAIIAILSKYNLNLLSVRRCVRQASRRQAQINVDRAVSEMINSRVVLGADKQDYLRVSEDELDQFKNTEDFYAHCLAYLSPLRTDARSQLCVTTSVAMKGRVIALTGAQYGGRKLGWYVKLSDTIHVKFLFYRPRSTLNSLEAFWTNSRAECLIVNPQ